MSDTSNHNDDDDDDDVMLFAAVKEWADAQEKNDGKSSIMIEGSNSVDANSDENGAINMKINKASTKENTKMTKKEKKEKKDKKDKKKEKKKDKKDKKKEKKKEKKKDKKDKKEKKKLKTMRSSDNKNQTPKTKSFAVSSGSGVALNNNNNNASQPYNPSSTVEVSEQPQRSRTQQNKYSLHITNLPYTATKEDIIKIFTSHGCKVTSTRLVYNYHKKTLYGNGTVDAKSQKNLPSSGFTGVAFVDLVDQISFEMGLKLDKVTWSKATTIPKGGNNDGATATATAASGGGKWGGKNRRMNVRPTRTKEELANIVKRTKEKLAIAREQKKKQEDENTNSTDVSNIHSSNNTSQQPGHNKVRNDSFSDKKEQEKNKRKIKSKRAEDSVGKSVNNNDKSDYRGSQKKRKNSRNEKNGSWPNRHKKQRKEKKKSKDSVNKEES